MITFNTFARYLSGMIKHISFLFVFITSYACYSQEYFKSNTIIKENITHTNLTDDGFGKKIFSLLGYENNIDVHNISLQAKARTFIRISRDLDNIITAKVSITKVNIEGSVTLRDFNVDSLLWPSGFIATLNIVDGINKSNEIQIAGPVSGKLIKINVNDYVSPRVGEINATITNIQFNYDKSKLVHLQELAETIGYYYSYEKLLDALVVNYTNHIVTNNHSLEQVFIGKIEIDRVNEYYTSHNFSSTLNLENHDPINLLKLTKKINRLSKRAETLFNQQISNKNPDILNPSLFCRYYCELSFLYLAEAELLQPDDASGFREIAGINPTINAKNDLSLITVYFSQNNSVKPSRLYQCIANGFVNMAKEVSAEDNYTDALLLLNNSLIVQNWSGISKTEEFNSVVLTALDGVSSSYLRVGNVALTANNLDLASQYLQKADYVLKSNRKLINYNKLPDSAFKNYLQLQYEITMKYIGFGKYETALNRLSTTRSICSSINNSIGCKLIDTSICMAHEGKLNYLLDIMDEMIIDGQYPDAYQQFLISERYKDENSCYLLVKNERFEDISYSLFLELLQRGEILIDAQQPRIALDNLLKARVIQQTLTKDIINIDRLIQLAAEPLINNLIEEAEYHTWANRMHQADSLYKKIIELNETYFLNNNDQISKAINDLHDKLLQRECISHEIKYSDVIRKINILIKNNQFSKLGKLLDEAEEYATSHPKCNIQLNEVQELRNEYNPVLTYFELYDAVSKKLFNQSHNEVIDMYVNLIEYYNYNNIFHYNIFLPSIEEFITMQKLTALTKATAKYYLERNILEISLQYIWMFKDQNGSSKSIAQITKELAKKLAIRDSELKKPAKESLLEYTSGDSWFSHFKTSYLRSRLLN